MAYDAGQVLIEVTKLVLLPALGFLAGFASQWVLQERKSRDELVRALAEERAGALRKLWEITTLPVEIRSLSGDAAVPAYAARARRHFRSRLVHNTGRCSVPFVGRDSTALSPTGHAEVRADTQG